MFLVSVLTGSEVSSPVSASVPSAIASGAGMSARRNSCGENCGRLRVEIIKGMLAPLARHGRHEIFQRAEHTALLRLRIQLLVVRVLSLCLLFCEMKAALFRLRVEVEHRLLR